MIGSEGFPFAYQRRPALMFVYRNDGFAWGRIETTDEAGELLELDVYTARDWYEAGDEKAAAAFIRAARKPANVDPATAWRRG